MKYAYAYHMLMVVVFCTSCSGQNQTDLSKEKIKFETKDVSTSRWIYTKYEYTDSIGKRLIIKNSFPKGGMKYTASNGEVYSCAIFFTQLINETDNPLKLKINFPIDSFEVASLPDKYFKILIPPNTMTSDKEPLFNYGLKDWETFLDNAIHKSSSLNRTINPKESNGFYVVILCLSEGAHGIMRAGLSLKGQYLFYRIKIDGSKSNTKSSDKEIQCGSIDLKNLILLK